MVRLPFMLLTSLLLGHWKLWQLECLAVGIRYIRCCQLNAVWLNCRLYRLLQSGGCYLVLSRLRRLLLLLCSRKLGRRLMIGGGGSLNDGISCCRSLGFFNLNQAGRTKCASIIWSWNFLFFILVGCGSPSRNRLCCLSFLDACSCSVSSTRRSFRQVFHHTLFY